MFNTDSRETNGIPYIITLSDPQDDISDIVIDNPIELTVLLIVPAVIKGDWADSLKPTDAENTFYDTRFHFKQEFKSIEELCALMDTLDKFAVAELSKAFEAATEARDTDPRITVTETFIDVALGYVEDIGESILNATKDFTFTVGSCNDEETRFLLAIRGPSSALNPTMLQMEPVYNIARADGFEIGYMLTHMEEGSVKATATEVARSLFNAIASFSLQEKLRDDLEHDISEYKYANECIEFSKTINSVTDEYFTALVANTEESFLDALSGLSVVSRVEVDKDKQEVIEHTVSFVTETTFYDAEDSNTWVTEIIKDKVHYITPLTIGGGTQLCTDELKAGLDRFKALVEYKSNLV